MRRRAPQRDGWRGLATAGRNRRHQRSFRPQNIDNRENDMADEYDTDRPVERTTIVETGNGGGSGGVLAVVLLIIVVLVLLFLFRDQLGLGGSKTEVSIPDKIEVNVN
jgi:uncharacterized membrane protein